MHNDLAPAESLRQYSFGPELVGHDGGRYVELDLIVPEYVKPTEIWQKLPWYAAFQADTGPKDKPDALPSRGSLVRAGVRDVRTSAAQ